MIEEPLATGDDRVALAGLAHAFAEAWNRHDAVALGALFAHDADFVNVLGMRWRGRPEITEMHARILGTIFAKSELAIGEVDVRPFGSNAAAVRADWKMTGHTPAPGTWEAERRGQLLMIAVRADDGWELADAQNTETASVAPPGVPH